MTLQNQSFDKRLVELKSKITEIEREIKAVELEKDHYIKNLSNRKQALLANSVVLDDAALEVYDGTYFLVFKDKDFEYVARLTKDQAAYLADDLDSELGKAHVDSLFQHQMVNNMFNGMFSGGK
jgi:uncharacterized protein YjcR